MPLDASRCKEARKRLTMSKKMRYSSSVAMAVPVRWLKRREEMMQEGVGLAFKEDDGPGR